MKYLIGEKKRQEKVVALISGGMDSTISLAWATDVWSPKNITAVSILYGQTHEVELASAKKIASLAGVEHLVLRESALSELKGSALLDRGIDVNLKIDGLPATFVPSRNLLFLSIASAVAYRKGARNIVLGAGQADWTGYPDTRDNSLKLSQCALSSCLGKEVTVWTPCMWLTKAEEIELMKDLGKLDWLKFTYSCYRGGKKSCGSCPSCRKRIQAFKEARVIDPIEYEVDLDWSGCERIT